MKNSDLFISYSHADSDFALGLAEDLRKNNVHFWFDQFDIPSGAIWDSEIQKALKNCKTLIVLISESSVISNNVLDEISYAIEENKRVIPLIVNSCDIPFRIRRLQYIDFSADYPIGFKNLLKSLDQKVENPVYTVRAKKQIEPEKKFSKTPLILGIVTIVACFLLYVMTNGNTELNDNTNTEEVHTGQGITQDNTKSTSELVPQAAAEKESPSIAKTNVTISYRGDLFGCTLPISITIAGKTMMPTGVQSFVMKSIPLGEQKYKLTGSVTCENLGTCVATGEGVIDVTEGATFFVYWQNSDLGTCKLWLQTE